MLKSSDVSTWLQGLSAITTYMETNQVGWGVDGFIDPQFTQSLVVVTVTGGAGTLFERTYDVSTLQCYVIGNQDDPVSAETLTETLDDAVMGLVPPIDINGTHCIDLDYSGGPPHWLQRDLSHRDHFVTNFVLTIARNVF
jgi:hypothetical protein